MCPLVVCVFVSLKSWQSWNGGTGIPSFLPYQIICLNTCKSNIYHGLTVTEVKISLFACLCLEWGGNKNTSPWSQSESNDCTGCFFVSLSAALKRQITQLYSRVVIFGPECQKWMQNWPKMTITCIYMYSLVWIHLYQWKIFFKTEFAPNSRSTRVVE